MVALASPGEHGKALTHKLEAIGFGFFVPIFFVTTGLRYDLHALLSSTKSLLLLPMFLVLFLVVRGLPALLARRDLDLRSRIALGLLSATQLPLVVAIVEIGVRSGRLNLETAASLVGAGMFSVLLFPIVACLCAARPRRLMTHRQRRWVPAECHFHREEVVRCRIRCGAWLLAWHLDQ